MTEQTNTRIPAPLYAAAGAGDLAYQQLRKLPAVVSELSDRAVASLRTANDTASTTAASLKTTATATDFDKLRETATTGAVAFAQAAQERAVAVYTSLVAHGERVVGTGVVEAADVVNADITATEEPKAVEAAQLREKASTTDFDALRGNAASVATSIAQIAQDRAVAAYTALVARGEKVVGTGVVEAADVVNADIETTEEPKVIEAAKPAPKPRKRVAKPAAE